MINKYKPFINSSRVANKREKKILRKYKNKLISFFFNEINSLKNSYYKSLPEMQVIAIATENLGKKFNIPIHILDTLVLYTECSHRRDGTSIN